MLLQKLIVCVPMLLGSVCSLSVHAQSSLEPVRSGAQSPATPLTQPTLSPGALQLLTLDGQFAQAVAKGGGAAFASWFSTLR